MLPEKINNESPRGIVLNGRMCMITCYMILQWHVGMLLIKRQVKKVGIRIMKSIWKMESV